MKCLKISECLCILVLLIVEVLKEGSFAINRLEVSEVNWNAFDDWNTLEFESERSDTLSDGGYNVAQCMRAVVEPMLVSHFDEAIIEEVFSRYQQILADRMSKEKTKFTNVTILLTLKLILVVWNLERAILALGLYFIYSTDL